MRAERQAAFARSGDPCLAPPEPTRGFLWRDGMPVAVPVALADGTPLEAEGRNALGWICAVENRADGTWRSFAWRDGIAIPVEPGFPDRPHAAAGWINAAGRIVGVAGDAAGNMSGFASTPAGPDAPLPATFQRIDAPGAVSTRPAVINDAGTVVGAATEAGGRTRAFRWENGVLDWTEPLPGASHTANLHVNNAGWIVGDVRASAEDRARGFLARPGTAPVFLDFAPTGDTHPGAINDAGQVVGLHYDPAVGRPRAFLWECGIFTPLLPGALASVATGINDAGEIVGHLVDGARALGFLRRRDGSLVTFARPDAACTCPFTIDSTGCVTGYDSPATTAPMLQSSGGRMSFHGAARS